MMLYLTVRLSVKNPKYEESEKKGRKEKTIYYHLYILLYKSIKRDKKTCGRQKKKERDF